MAYPDPNTEDDDDETGEPQGWMERIATALADHCGIELGDISACEGDEDKFAHLIEVAAANSRNSKDKVKAKKVRMSQRANARRPVSRPTSDDAAAASFIKHVYND